jgi:formylglycine-generating enzyme required for sulfatase activity
MTGSTPPGDAACPYVGLQPFREVDYPYFFGRERDVRVIASNLREQPLTVVYGASGVGKSSALRAGVLPHLGADAGAVAVYYNTWQKDTFLEDLTAQCRAALGVNDPGLRLEQLVASGKRRMFLLLDQFEELMLYHRSGAQAEEFDSLLARIVNRDDLAANVLIGIREDALSRFDQRFSIRIADLLANTLPLEHLNNEAARRAILQPLRVFNEKHALDSDGYSMEPELAEEILRQVQPRQFAEAADERAAGSGPGQVETPFLQLVLQRLWTEETRHDSRRLRLETLRQIGGALQIVDKHVNDVLAGLPRGQDREIAAKMFRYLVTPSRSKIAQDTESLVGYGEAPEAEVRPVLSWLSDKPESRILRRLDTPERYEIFHDVLAQPILDWRKKYFAERERIEESRKRRRLLVLAGAMALLALAAVGFALFAFDQRRRARVSADLAQSETQRARVATNEAQEARAHADEAANELRAKQSEAAGREAEAARFRDAAEAAAKQAEDYKGAAEQERSKAADLLAGKDRSYQDAAQQIASLRSERDQLQSRVTSLNTDLEQLKSQLGPSNATKVNPKDGLTYVEIPPGTFLMGCFSVDQECLPAEKPAHQVTITKGFWIGQTPVTQAAYQRVTRLGNPSSFKGPDLPVETVTWNEAQSYCQAVGMRLPTEAEWEYAARAGSTASRYGDLDRIAWYLANSGVKTHPVGQKQANAWGLYDMLGNVLQWTADWYGPYAAGSLTDPRGPATGSLRTLRGASYVSGSRYARVSYRSGFGPVSRHFSIGLRCAGMRTLP